MNQEDMSLALLVGLDTGEDPFFIKSMDELAELAKACNIIPADQMIQHMPDVNKAYYIGPGKVQEVKLRAEEIKAETIIFDNALSPSQLRNLQDEIGLAVLDRTTLILEIFALRAKTKEAMLQVEVARLQYFLPRLVGLNKALSRQGGASGSKSSKGAGEKKLELDRRRLENRLTECRRELKEVVEKRNTQRKLRESSGICRVALVGYTNAGKSTLMNAMIDLFNREDLKESKMVMTKDMLFATLDTTVRKIAPLGQPPILLSDTVGFIHNLPHHLVDAFRSTLEEAAQSDLILIVVDSFDDNHREQIKVTEETLNQLNAGKIPTLFVYNKADCYMADAELGTVRGEKIYISAEKRLGLEVLYDEIIKKLAQGYQECTMCIPYTRGDIASYMNQSGNVREQEYTEKGILMKVYCPVHDYEKYKEFTIAEQEA